MQKLNSQLLQKVSTKKTSTKESIFFKFLEIPLKS